MTWPSLLSAQRFSDKSGNVTHDKNRSRFEQDYDRIIFSQPFRRLQDKTQVFPLPEDDFVHTRLTHSLEVSSVGRSLGKNAGLFLLDKYPELKEAFSVQDFGSIVASACLAHDLGNPPFGHSGEEGISSFFRHSANGQSLKELVTPNQWLDLSQFEGNAQGFRILNNPAYRGVELTFATLGAFTKYPLASSSAKIEGRKSQKKYGFFQSDKEKFSTMASQMGLISLGENAWCRHPLAFLVEAADDICYTIIDLEDGCRLGLVSFATYKELLAPIIGADFDEAKLKRMNSSDEKLGILRAMAISQLVQECSGVFKDHEASLRRADFDKALTDVIPAAKTLEAISSLSVRDIYRSRRVLEKEAGGYEVINKLMDAFCMAAIHQAHGQMTGRDKTVMRLLPEVYQNGLQAPNITTYQILQIITDYISSLTDRYAIKLYKIVYGL